MRKLTLLAGCIMLLAFTADAQVSGGGKPFSFTNTLSDNFETAKVIMPAIDVEALRRQANETYAKGEMLPAGQIFPVSLSPENSGVWTVLPNKDRVWRLFIQVPRAPATSLYFDNFYIPEGGVLYVYNADKTHVIGSFDTHNNHESKLFATEIVYTENCVIEYYEKANVKRRGSFTITGIANVYNAPKPPSHLQIENFGGSGSCNVNVNCPEGTIWTNQRNSVARILAKNGTFQGWCSGSLINNAAGDCKNYFLTANHNGAATVAADKNQWVFYFNYQSPACSNPAAEPGSNTVTGCTMRASSSNGANSIVHGSDFMLVEINSVIPAAYNVYYAGFDATNIASNSGVGIHHPNGDIKKISTYNTTTTTRGYYTQLPNNSHWQATWINTVTNLGITEGGSSGSPLFHSNGRVMGILSGGPSSCTSPAADKKDYYGKVSYAWISEGTAASQRLKPWLDPGNINATFIPGRAPCPPINCPDIQEPNNSQATAGTISPGITYKALIATSTDNDYYKFTVSAGSTINISLTTLPFDYDLQLLNSAGTVVGSSAAGGTTSESITYNNAPAGTYTVRAYGYNAAFSGTVCYTLLASVVPPCTNTPEPNETMATGILIPVHADIFSQIASTSDPDWYKFDNTTAAPNIYITLGNLPADYDLTLYSPTGTLLASSAAGGTNNESIIYNTSAIGTYAVRVYGYNGAFSTSVCYRLRAETSGTPKSTRVQSSGTKDDLNIVTISPNPVASKLTISYTANMTGMEKVIITDITGRRILLNTINSREGKNDIGIILPSNLTKGIYLLKVGERNPVKFIKE